MALKDIAPGIRDRLKGAAAAPIGDGPLETSLDALPKLSLLPFYCDPGVQWAVSVRRPDGRPVDAKAIRKVKGIAVTVRPEGLDVGIPGDGIDPALVFFEPLASALASLPSGTIVELLSANLGTVHRDNQVKLDGVSTAGDQSYTGHVGEGGRWVLTHAHPAASAAALRQFLDLAARVESRGPWRVRDEAEAADLLEEAFDSPAFNVGLGAFRRKIRAHGNEITLTDLDTKHLGMGLMFFRRQFADGPWDVAAGRRLDADARARNPRPDVKKEVMAEVFGRR